MDHFFTFIWYEVEKDASRSHGHGQRDHQFKRTTQYLKHQVREQFNNDQERDHN